jgi:deoxyribodipyrimidine photolyase
VRVAIGLFTRDLRVNDQPALGETVRSRRPTLAA